MCSKHSKENPVQQLVGPTNRRGPALPLALALSYYIWMKRCGSTYEEARCTAITGEQAMIFYKDGEAFWEEVSKL